MIDLIFKSTSTQLSNDCLYSSLYIHGKKNFVNIYKFNEKNYLQSTHTYINILNIWIIFGFCQDYTNCNILAKQACFIFEYYIINIMKIY